MPEIRMLKAAAKIEADGAGKVKRTAESPINWADVLRK